MKKKNTLITIGVVLTVALALSIFFFLQEKPNTPKQIVEVSNVTIDHGIDWSNCKLNFTVTNLYNYPVTAMGSTVNGINYGYSNLTVPPGQTQDESFILPHLVITSSTNYNTTLAFTFGNGQYQVSSQSVLPPKYMNAFFITNQSLTKTWSNNTIFSVTIQNTGNIPIVSVNYTLGNYQSLLPLQRNLMPQNSAVLNDQPILSNSLQTGITYLISLQVNYADGSTSSAQSSVPSETEAPTPTPASAPSVTGKAIQIQSVANSTTVSPGQMDIYVQNVGDSPVTFNSGSVLFKV